MSSGPVPSSPPSRWIAPATGPRPIPRLSADDRWLTGVASGIAHNVGVQPIVIRAAFVLLLTAGLWGGVLYLISWYVMGRLVDYTTPYDPQPMGKATGHRHAGVGLIVLGMLLLLRLINFGFVGDLVWPAAFILIGALIAWSHGRDYEAGISTIARISAGVAVGVGGLICFGAFQFELRDGLLALLFSVAVVAGVAVIAAPSLMRIATNLDDARNDRVRADERARFAAHLHDSVLQTLSLIQRHADDPATTAQLARQQERELRAWLYAAPTPGGSVRLSHTLNDLATQVEAEHRVPIEVVVVGDEAMEAEADDRLDALVGAAREAMRNAAEHSGAPRVDVFAELRDGHAEIFIRDTGSGFSREAIEADRRGIAESIEARMTRHGGSATIHTAEGEGTEVELRMELTERVVGDGADSTASPAEAG